MKAVEENTGRVDISTIKTYQEVKKGYTPFVNGDLIFAKITPCMENGKIAVLSGLKNNTGFGSTEFHVSRLTDFTYRQYVFYYLVQEQIRRKARLNMTGSAGQLRVPSTFFEMLPIPLASLEEQHQIVQEIEARLSECDQLEQTIAASLRKAESLRQSLLKHAFEGKLTAAWRARNPDLIAGEHSAAALLEKIKKMSEP